MEMCRVRMSVRACVSVYVCTLMSRRYNTTFKQTKCLDLSCASECMSSGLTHVTRS